MSDFQTIKNFLSYNPTRIGSVGGAIYYEHPLLGDETTLLAVYDGYLWDTSEYEVPDSNDTHFWTVQAWDRPNRPAAAPPNDNCPVLEAFLNDPSRKAVDVVECDSTLGREEMKRVTIYAANGRFFAVKDCGLYDAGTTEPVNGCVSSDWERVGSWGDVSVELTQYCDGCDNETPSLDLSPTLGGLYCPACCNDRIEITEDEHHGLTVEYS